MSTPTCYTCGHQFAVGEVAWAQEWSVMGDDGLRTEIRYTCDGWNE